MVNQPITYQFQHVPGEEGVKGREFKPSRDETQDGAGYRVPDVGAAGHTVDEVHQVGQEVAIRSATKYKEVSLVKASFNNVKSMMHCPTCYQ